MAQTCTCLYDSPPGGILITADDEGITEVYFADRKAEAKCPGGEGKILSEARRWFDEYFAGKAPSWVPPLHIEGSDFEKEVCAILLKIPYGKTRTYGDIADEISKKRGRKSSARAVGGGVGRNPICIIVPCHRVVGANGNLTGYAEGMDRKVALLKLEKADMKGFYVPKARKH